MDERLRRIYEPNAGIHISTAPARGRIKPISTRTVARAPKAPARAKAATADKTILTQPSLPRSLRAAQYGKAVNGRTSPMLIEYKLGSVGGDTAR